MDPIAKKTVVILMPPALTESFEIVLSRVLELRKENIALYLISCNGETRGCVTNMFGLRCVCDHCCRVRNKAFDDFKLTTFSVNMASNRIKNSRKHSTGKSVKKWIDEGVRSTILTFYRFDIRHFNQPFVRGYIFRFIEKQLRKYSHFVYDSVNEHLACIKPDRVEFFNGRIVPTRAAMYAAIKSDVQYSTIEVWGHPKKLLIIENNSPHDLPNNQNELNRYVFSGQVDSAAGKLFFEKRKNGEYTNAKSFTSAHKRGLIGRSSDKPILAIFTSSPDEQMLRADQWFNEASRDPLGFILSVVAEFSQKFRIIVRMHPNQGGDKTGATKKMISRLSMEPYLELIKPDDPHSTYEVLDMAEIVLTFGTSVGLEATYWGKPSVLCGRAIWDALDVQYKAASISDLKDLFSRPLAPRSQAHALAVAAYYMNGRGQESCLSYMRDGNVGYFADGVSYLEHKRDSSCYWISRIIDRVLRRI